MSRPMCVFCEIVSGHARADVVFETKDVLCVLPLEMEVDGHVLLVPKAHCETLFDIAEDELSAVPRFDNDRVDAWPSLPGSGADRSTLLARLQTK